MEREIPESGKSSILEKIERLVYSFIILYIIGVYVTGKIIPVKISSIAWAWSSPTIDCGETSKINNNLTVKMSCNRSKKNLITLKNKSEPVAIEVKKLTISGKAEIGSHTLSSEISKIPLENNTQTVEIKLK